METPFVKLFYFKIFNDSKNKVKISNDTKYKTKNFSGSKNTPETLTDTF